MTGFTERRPYYAEAPLAVVVGCGGLGMSVARVLGQRDPLLITDIDGERLNEAVETLRDEGFIASGEICDITDADQTETLGAKLADGPGIRVIAHVAGVGVTIGTWQKMIAVDLIGPHRIAQALGPHMVRGGVGIFVGSIAGYLPVVSPEVEAALDDALEPAFLDNLAKALGAEPDLWNAYNLAKLGVMRLAEQLAVAWGPNEVRAVSLSPGLIDTAMGRANGSNIPAADGKGLVPRNERVREIPLARQGSVVEISKVLAFLASDGASFINGIDILVDGGLRAVWRKQGRVAR